MHECDELNSFFLSAMKYENIMIISRYDTQWYVAPVQMQKLLLFMMQRSMKSCNFIVDDLYCITICAELFTTITCMMDVIINLTSVYSFLQNNEFIFLACEPIITLLHNNLFCATMKLIKKK